MKMIAIKKHIRGLKVWSVEMPNAPYSKRWLSFKNEFETEKNN